MDHRVIFTARILYGTACAKVSFLLGNYSDWKKIEHKLQKSIRGEFFDENLSEYDNVNSNYFLYFCNFLRFKLNEDMEKLHKGILGSIVSYII